MREWVTDTSRITPEYSIKGVTILICQVLVSSSFYYHLPSVAPPPPPPSSSSCAVIITQSSHTSCPSSWRAGFQKTRPGEQDKKTVQINSLRISCIARIRNLFFWLIPLNLHCRCWMAKNRVATVWLVRSSSQVHQLWERARWRISCVSERQGADSFLSPNELSVIISEVCWFGQRFRLVDLGETQPMLLGYHHRVEKLPKRKVLSSFTFQWDFPLAETDWGERWRRPEEIALSQISMVSVITNVGGLNYNRHHG